MYPEELVAQLELVSATRQRRKTVAPAAACPPGKDRTAEEVPSRLQGCRVQRSTDRGQQGRPGDP